MEDTPALPLPNEMILSILNHLTTLQLLPIAPTCRHFYNLVISTLTQRLRDVETLDGYTLCLECHHPSARLTARRLSCISLGTRGLEPVDGHNLDEIARLRNLYTSFRPQTSGMTAVSSRPGDIPGSRTYNSSSNKMSMPTDVVQETIMIEANDLFTQLSTVAYLAKCEAQKGILVSLQNVVEGTIRVWRDWLSRRCESRMFSDQTAIIVQHEPTANVQSQGSSKNNILDDGGVLWVNTKEQDLGLRLRVKYQRKRQTAMPLMYSSEIEIAVSYVVEIEEILVRTSHLLLRLEAARESTVDESSQAIIFRSYQ